VIYIALKRQCTDVMITVAFDGQAHGQAHIAFAFVERADETIHLQLFIDPRAFV
jgi:hypothetical protein